MSFCPLCVKLTKKSPRGRHVIRWLKCNGREIHCQIKKSIKYPSSEVLWKLLVVELYNVKDIGRLNRYMKMID